ncbi:MAG: hypothetical protein A2Z77_00895 [Chloroflexi bacterium RBG_13_51_36]|nr:MAG: hypothetical protein A2Z77_00895 [Chloroflexi bacterium RBG_13_51_36]
MGKRFDEIRAIETEYIDPLYGIYRIDEPFASTLNHAAIQNQIERLRNIKSLGLIFHFFPAGNHTKWEHYLGMYSVAKNMKYGLNKPEREELEWLCLLRGLGHLPCTYVSASAVFMAIKLSSGFERRLRALIRPIASKICSGCNDGEYCSDKPNVAIFENHGYEALRGALSARKLIRLPSEIDIGHRDSLARGCVCPKSRSYRICNAISRYDYMQRDLYHTGLARFNMSCDEAFRTLNDGVDTLEASPPMRLLDELYDYLVDSLYLRPDIACCESLLAKLLAAKLCAGEIDLDALIEYDDMSLMRNLEMALRSSPMAYVKEHPAVFIFRVDIPIHWFDTLNPTALEMQLLGAKGSQKRKLLTYPEEDGAILSVHHMWDDPEGGPIFRVILNVVQASKKIRPAVSIAFSLRDRFLGHRLEDSLKLPEQILAYALGRKRITHDDSRVRASLSSMFKAIGEGEANKVIWDTYDILLRCADRKDLDIPPVARRFWRMLQHPARMRSRSLRGEELGRVWEVMLTGLCNIASNPNIFGEAWVPIFGQLSHLVRSGANSDGEVYEALAYASELVSAKRGRPRAVLPSMRFDTDKDNRNDKGDSKNEIDVVSLELWPESVEIRMIECTKMGSAGKATDDHSKLERFKGILESQRFSDLKVSIKVVSNSQVGKDFVSIGKLLKPGS